MLVNMNEVLLPAKKNHYAVGLFNAVNLELARGIIAAAESSRSPVIMGTGVLFISIVVASECLRVCTPRFLPFLSIPAFS